MFPWMKGKSNVNLIHPEDIENITTNIGLVKCTGIKCEYLELKTKNFCFRGLKEGVKLFLPSPKFNYDELVIILKNEKKGIINRISWHYKNSEFLYYLTIGGKNKSKRYKEEDLRK